LDRSLFGAREWLLEQGMIPWDTTQLALLDTLRTVEPTLPAQIVWEQILLQSWRDSLDLLLTVQDRGEERPLNPFELAITQFSRETVVLVDPETGHLEKAYWYLPVYGQEGCTGCRVYNAEFRAFKERLRDLLMGKDLPIASADPFPNIREQVWQPLPLLAGFDDHYSFNAQAAQQSRRVPPDAIHTYSHPFRDVLGDAELPRYPVLLLEWIDVESATKLARYLLAGGFVLINRAQLDLLESALTEQAGKGLVRRIDIWSRHPLMDAYYTIAEYYPAPRQANDPPLQGLELDGRLVAVTQYIEGSPWVFLSATSHKPELFVNSVVYGLIQPSKLGGRYLSR